VILPRRGRRWAAKIAAAPAAVVDEVIARITALIA
jgi:hypothetical protein